jgi:hypothetical protein
MKPTFYPSTAQNPDAQQPAPHRPDTRHSSTPNPMTPDPSRPNPSDPHPDRRSADPERRPDLEIPSKPPPQEIPAKPRRDLPQPDPERAQQGASQSPSTGAAAPRPRIFHSKRDMRQPPPAPPQR